MWFNISRDLNGARNIARRYMLSDIPQHTCSGNVRLSPMLYAQQNDNRENQKGVKAMNRLVWLQNGYIKAISLQVVQYAKVVICDYQ